LKTAINIIGIPEAVDINLFALPGVNFYDSANSVRYALNMVEERADSLYIIDAPQSSDALESDIVVSELASTGIDSNYAATYWPWVQILDQNLNQYVYIAPTAQVVQSIAYTDNVSYPWFAPAGFNRGLMNVTKAQLKLTKTDRDTLYDQRINPIATFVQQGVVIFGQKTLQQRQSALDRINVRRLLLQVRKVIAAASQTLLFEQNDTVLQDQFKSKVDPILLQIQNNRGLYGYKIVMDSSNNTAETIDRNTLVGKIQLKPTRTAEFIDLTFQVLPTGASFQDF
jgi:phage tail sheath protein FI